jgi:antitoxin MazE
METTVQKWGNSLALRLPKAIAAQAQIREGSTVDLVPTDGGLLLKARPGPHYRLSDLLAGVNSKNIHCESDWGQSRGREIIE